MGLDMYLDKYPRIDLSLRSIQAVDELASWIEQGTSCVFDEWSRFTVNDLPDTKTIIKLLEMRHDTWYAWDDERKYPVRCIYDMVGYWRKSNAIHNWFVKNVQDGEDDCEYHRPVTKDDLETLFELCREVLADHSKASKLLPYRQGYFFGSYEYDMWYFKDIEYTAELCKKLIDTFDFNNYNLFYRSSW